MNLFFIRVLFFIAAVVLQAASIKTFFASWIFAPDVVLMLVLAWSALEGFSMFVFWIAVFSFLYDIFARTAFGLHLLIFSFGCYFAGFLTRRISVATNYMGILLTSLFIAAVTIFSEAILMIFGEQYLAVGQITHFLWMQKIQLFGAMICNGLVFIFWIYVLRRLKGSRKI